VTRAGGRSIPIFAVVLAIAVAFSSSPAIAVDRDAGEYWTYDVVWEIDGVVTNGTITRQFEDHTSIVVNMTSYDVNVYSVEGILWGTTEFIDSTHMISMTLGGVSYETTDGMAMLMEDDIMWKNSSWIVGPETFSSNMRTESVSEFSPPMASWFDPKGTNPGDTWLGLSVVETTTTVSNGTSILLNTHTEDYVTISFVASSAFEKVVTPAGEFRTLRVTATITGGEGAGDFEVYYWSPDVMNLVKREAFSKGESVPYQSFTLREYKLVTLNTVLFIMVGVAVLSAALIILAVVLHVRRGSNEPNPGQPNAPLALRLRPPPSKPPST